MKKTIVFLCIAIVGIAVLSAAPADNERLAGTWAATVEYNHSFDTYQINLFADGRCKVIMSNDSAEQETTGNWSYDGTMFKLNALFRNAKIAYQKNIQWTSVLTLVDGGSAFAILGKAAANGAQMRFTFYKQDNSFDENAVPALFDRLCEHIPLRARIAVVGITASDPNEGTWYLNALTSQLVNARKYTVVDRNDIDKVLTEQNFQMTGYVDDDAFISIGKFIGAAVIITGNISGTGAQKQLVIKAIDVKTAEILSMVSVGL